MKIYTHWAKQQVALKHPDGKTYDLTIRRGSNESKSQAAAQVDAAMKSLRSRVEQSAEHLDWYAYALRTKPEPIIDEIHDESARRAAAITLNAQGCQILNTQSLAFVDVDLPDSPSKPRLFSRKKQSDPTEPARTLLHTWVSQDPNRAARVYRTAAGLRYAITNPPLDPTAQSTQDLFTSLQADPLYTNLCKHQECFRARLTPKPWRTDLGHPSTRLTHDTLTDPAIDTWLTAYAAESENYATCHWIEDLNHARPANQTTAQILDLHDALTNVNTDNPLA